MEAANLTKEPITPRIWNTAKALWKIYLGLMLLDVTILKAAGMPLYV